MPRRTSMASLAGAAGLSLSSLAFAGTVDAFWLGAFDGDWTTGANWSTNPAYPDNTLGGPFHAIINAAGAPYTVTLDTAATVSAVTIDSPDVTFRLGLGVLVAGQVSILAGTLSVNSLTGQICELKDTTVQVGANGLLNVSDGTLRNVYVNGDVHLTAGEFLELRGGTRFDQVIAHRPLFHPPGWTYIFFGPNYTLHDPITLSGHSHTGRMLMAAPGQNLTFTSTASLTIAEDTSVEFTGAVLANSGLIEVTGADAELLFKPRTVNNQGVIRATAGFLQVNPNDIWTNSGVIEALGGVVEIDGGFDITNGIGTVRAVGGQIVVSGWLINHGNTLMLDDTTGVWKFQNGSVIDGGSFAVLSGGGLQLGPIGSGSESLRFQNVEILTPLELSAGRVRIVGSTTFEELRLGGDLRIIWDCDAVIEGEISVHGTGTNETVIWPYDLIGNPGPAMNLGPTARIDIEPGSNRTLEITAKVVSAGVIESNAGNGGILLDGAQLINNGHIAANAGVITIAADETTNNGVIYGAGGGEGTVEVAASVDFQCPGRLETGAHAQGIRILQDLTLEATSEVAVGLKQVPGGIPHGSIEILGHANLAGALEIYEVSNIYPAWGDSWDVLEYDSNTGDFSTFTFPVLDDPNLAWWAEPGETEYTIGVRHIADLDHNGFVWFADLNILLGAFNGPGAPEQGDLNGDGVVSFDDLNALIAHLGAAAF